MMRFWRDRSIRFRPDRRRPDDWADVHDRARSLAAERLSEPLGPGDAAWLVEHLATCPPCQEVATAYERQRDALRALAAP
ncbi:MAG TPA: zf-HC2 domain-containing protein, partial [Candidatus Binatia bacterium]|nr:zf-HC2 domain-containing protein [Candidatus Binatia bacterium]